MLGRKLRPYELRVGGFFVHLVDGNDDTGVGFAGEPDGLDGLRLNAVVCGDDDDDHVGQCRTVLTQRRKSFVTWRIKQRDFSTVLFYLVGRNVLGDTTGFAVDGLGFKDRV